MTEAAAIVLAGGRSQRMGTPKAWLEFDGQPLIAHNVRALGQLFEEIVVVASPTQELPATPARIVRDEIPHQGPVGGVYYGFGATNADVCFVTSCDSVFLNPRLISYLLSQAAGFDVVVPYWQEHLHPLHAVYRRTVVPFLAAQLRSGELRLADLFQRVRTRLIEREEIADIDPEGASFFNVNTPEDYAAAVRRWDASRAAGKR
jgi:molybdopterin-guanine dinucleotide biosynthesis protein A